VRSNRTPRWCAPSKAVGDIPPMISFHAKIGSASTSKNQYRTVQVGDQKAELSNLPRGLGVVFE
jgi:hypothetical protein